MATIPAHTGHILFVLLIVLGLAGCASLNKNECLNSDWRLIGYEDGTAGQDQARIGSHRKACAKHGVIPDMQAYLLGRNEGLEVYCQQDVGYRTGLSGRQYNGVCPKKLEPLFLGGFEAGRAIYVVKRTVSNKKKAIAHHEQLLAANQDAMVAVEEQLNAKGLTREERREILAEVKALAKEQQQLESDIRIMEKELIRLEFKQDQLTGRAPYGG